MEILSKYNKQDKILESESYSNYLKKLSIFFNEETNDKYEKIEEDNYYKLIDKNNDANTITIYKIKMIDLNIYLKEINDKLNNIYKQISEIINDTSDKDQEELFEKLKEEYSEIIVDKNEILKIFKIQDTKILKLQEEKINLIIQLYVLYDKRKESFKATKPINHETKKKIINLYKQKYKLISDNDYTHYSKKLNVPFTHLKTWSKWLHSSYLYIQLQLKINNVINMIQIQENKIDNINHNYIINVPKVKENKVVSI